MNERQVSEAIRDWVQAELAEIQSGYAYPVASKVGALPDVVALVTRKRVAPDHEEFPFSQLQQRWMRIFSIEASIMVDGADAETSHQQLQDFGERLEAALTDDATLGGRVEMTSPRVDFDYSTPFAVYEDGTQGRMLFINLTVGELVDAPF